VLCLGGVAFLWRLIDSPFGYALRAGRDSPLRAEAIGIDVRAQQWAAFGVAGCLPALAAPSTRFSKGSISPETLSVPRSVDAWSWCCSAACRRSAGRSGRRAFHRPARTRCRARDYWRAAIGAVILVLVIAFPRGIFK